MKKLLSLLLCLLTVYSVVCVNVSAATTSDSMNIYGVYLSREGDCSLIESSGKWLLIDTGTEDTSTELLQKLNYYGIKELDVLITHFHYDHTDGFEALAQSDIKINKVYLPDPSLIPLDPYTNSKYNSLRSKALLNNDSVDIEDLKKGIEFELGTAKAVVLGPVGNIVPDDFANEEEDEKDRIDHYINCKSLTIKFTCGNTSFLTAGDIEEEEELALVNAYKGTNTLDCDILKLSHHAVYGSNSEEFLQAVSPKYSYALNSNKIQTATSNYRMYYTSCKNASKYGPVYLVGDEKLDFGCKVVNDNIEIYKGTSKLSGLVSLTGADGIVIKKNKYYITPNPLKEGVYTIDGKKYYIFEGGLAKQAHYSFDLKKYIYKYEPVKGGVVRYFDTEAVMFTGFRKVGDYTYYFDENTGIMLRGDENYSPITIGGKKYGVKTSGVIFNYGAKSGAWKKYSDNYRYFDKNGVMKTGWLTVGSKKYYLNLQTGLRTLGLKKISGKYYYFTEAKSAGYAYTSGWLTAGKNYRYFDKNGVMKTGWLNNGGKKYYLNAKSGLRTLGLKKISGKYYYFVESKSAGYAYNSGWKKFGKNYRYFDKNGVMKTGWLAVGGKKYYLNAKSGLRTLGLKKISGKYYYFVESKSAGYAYTSGWKKFGKNYRYFDKSGVMQTGWVKVGKKYYYLNTKSGYRTVGLKKIDGKTYYFQEKKSAAYRYSGWKKFGSKKRYFDKNGVMAVGKKKIDGKTYKFDKNGYLKK